MTTEFCKILKDYLEETGLTIAAFARVIKMDRATVYRWFEGKNPISKRGAKKIEKETGGKIKAEDLICQKQ